METFAIISSEKLEQLLNDVAEIKDSLTGPSSALNEYVTVNELRKKLGISHTTVWRYEKEGKLLPKVIGNQKLYKLSDSIHNK
jgi:hypothetical protein